MKFFKADYDFDFDKDCVSKIIPFIIGFLIYSATIAIMSCIFTYTITNEWQKSLSGKITLEFQSSIDGIDENLTEKQKKDVISVVSNFPGVNSVNQLKEVDILKIIEPWLNDTAIPDDFPFPVVFDVDLKEGVEVNLLDLSNKLSKISSKVKVHDHANWYNPVLKIGNGLFSFAILLSTLILATMCATIILISRQALSIHENIVSILQLIGANNSYIASQFKRYYFMVGCKSSLFSIFLSILTSVCMNYLCTSQMITQYLLKYSLVVIFIPLIAIVLMMFTSQKSVIFFLNKDKWID